METLLTFALIIATAAIIYSFLYPIVEEACPKCGSLAVAEIDFGESGEDEYLVRCASCNAQYSSRVKLWGEKVIAEGLVDRFAEILKALNKRGN